MKTYISITINGIARITPNTPTAICGLGTYNIQTCIAAFFFNDKEMSLIHLTFATDLESLLTEAKKIGENCRVILVYNKSRWSKTMAYLQNTDTQNLTDYHFLEKIIDYLKTYLPHIMPQVYDSTTGDAYLTREGKLITQVAELDNARITFSPRARLRSAIHYLNAAIQIQSTLKPKKAVLEFNGEKFLEIEPIHDTGSKLLGMIRPYLRREKLNEDENGIIIFLEKEFIAHLKSTHRFTDDLKSTMAYCLKTLLENNISRQQHNNRPCFFMSFDNIKILYSNESALYAQRLHDILNDDDFEEKSENKEPQLVNNPNHCLKTPNNDANNKMLTLPLFWLRQLQDPAIDEITQEFKIDRRDFVTHFK